jgi:hypothetical protein
LPGLDSDIGILQQQLTAAAQTYFA